MNARQTKAVSPRHDRGLYVAEAIWTRYMPSRKMIQDVLDSGVIGKPNTLKANLSYVIADKRRIYDPALAGGALLDIGVYGLNFALMHFGNDIARVESTVAKMDTGVDVTETITLYYRDGRMAVLTHSVYCRSDRMGIIHGDKGYLVVENINNPQSIQVFDTQDRLLARYDVPEQVNGYEYEFQEAARCIGEGKLEPDSMPHRDTIEVMEMMDSLRERGRCYPQEPDKCSYRFNHQRESIICVHCKAGAGPRHRRSRYVTAPGQEPPFGPIYYHLRKIYLSYVRSIRFLSYSSPGHQLGLCSWPGRIFSINPTSSQQRRRY